ncbi:MAG: hypothetical protein IKZ62_02710 [Prevotella sp.]|nr:hypothetical protein [Prevotella sp.]
MKKFFTLIATVFMAIGANAQAVEIDYSTFAPWDNCTLDGNTFTFGAGWKGGGINVKGQDWYGKEYLWIVVESIETTPEEVVDPDTGETTQKPRANNVTFTINYNDWKETGQWGEVYQSQSKTIDDKGIIAIELDQDATVENGELTAKDDDGNMTFDDSFVGDFWIEHPREITIQEMSGAGGTMTIKSIAVGTLDDLKAAYEAEGIAWTELGEFTDQLEGQDPSTSFKCSATGATLEFDESEGAYKVDIDPASAGGPEDWQLQFFIAFENALGKGDQVYWVWDWKAKVEQAASMQPQIGQGGWCGIGASLPNVTTEWNTITTETYEKESVDHIAICLNNGEFQNTIYFKDMFAMVARMETGIVETYKLTKNGWVRYNLAGQKVDKSYKGLVIENGKKFIQK